MKKNYEEPLTNKIVREKHNLLQIFAYFITEFYKVLQTIAIDSNKILF